MIKCECGNIRTSDKFLVVSCSWVYCIVSAITFTVSKHSKGKLKSEI